MSVPTLGILDEKDLEHVNLDINPDFAHERVLQAPWKPAAALRKHRRTISLVKSWLWPQSRPRSKPLHATAYLDGLRGMAAFLVYWHHHELWVHNFSGLEQNKYFENAFGFEGNYHAVALPGVRTFFSGGHYAVSTFFVISGYVLSLKPLNLILNGELAALGEHLASAFFRRWLRLYLPIAATVCLYATSWHVLGIWVSSATQQGSWRDEMWSLYAEFKNFSFVFKEGGDPWLSYNYHLWSIPVEFKGSMVIFASLLAFSRASLSARLWCQIALAFYFLYIADGWYCAMFTMGMILCNLDLLAKRAQLPLILAMLEPYKTFIYYHLLIFSVYLGGVPSQNDDLEHLAKQRGWYFLSFLKPQAVFDYKWFYLFWAATFLVAAIPRIYWLKKFFETSFCQYLGRISYALYMVHGPVIWTLGDRLYMAAGWITDEQMEHIPWWANRLKLPRTGPMGLEVSFLVPHIILLPVTLFLAEVVTRGIDTPSVRFAGWLYRKTLAGAPGKQAKA